MITTPWPAERTAAFVRLWRQGASADVIAQATDLSPASVHTMAVMLRRWGHDLPHRHGAHGRPWPAERVAPVIEAIVRGVDNATLATVMNVSESSIGATLARLRAAGHAIPCRPPGVRRSRCVVTQTAGSTAPDCDLVTLHQVTERKRDR